MKTDRTDLIKDKTEGCMIGGAVGDALGYAVEFHSLDSIIRRYGEPGITRYELNSNGIAEISDDTQMSMFTANGVLLGLSREYTHGLMTKADCYCERTYIDWYRTQTRLFQKGREKDENEVSWLMFIPELYSRRAPGNTCLSAINAIIHGKEAENDSCGCGGVMRTAPISPFAVLNTSYDKDELDEYTADSAAKAARLTHKHPLGFLPSAVLAIILNELLRNEKATLKEAFDRALSMLPTIRDDSGKTYNELWPSYISSLTDLLECAYTLSQDNTISDADGIKCLGEGWTGHEALAIALFCAFRHEDSFEDAIVASVNHNGDSDSTGAICGNIMGTIVGLSGIPKHYLDNLELKDIILELADDIYNGCPSGEESDSDTYEFQRWTDLYERNIRRS